MSYKQKQSALIQTNKTWKMRVIQQVNDNAWMIIRAYLIMALDKRTKNPQVSWCIAQWQRIGPENPHNTNPNP